MLNSKSLFASFLVINLLLLPVFVFAKTATVRVINNSSTKSSSVAKKSDSVNFLATVKSISNNNYVVVKIADNNPTSKLLSRSANLTTSTKFLVRFKAPVKKQLKLPNKNGIKIGSTVRVVGELNDDNSIDAVKLMLVTVNKKNVLKLY